MGRKIKRDLSDSFIKEEEEVSYPEVNITKQQESATPDKLDIDSGKTEACGTTEKTVHSVMLPEETNENGGETSEESIVKNKQEYEDDIGDKHENIEEITDIGKKPLDGNEAFLTSSADLHVSTGIPDNFESLYKTALSCDDSDNVKFVMTDDNVKDETKTKGEDDEGQIDISEDTGVDLNIKAGASVRIETDRDKVMDGEVVNDEGGEAVDNDTDETEEASVTRDNLSLNFDEDNAELLELEKGLIAVCVGKN